MAPDPVEDNQSPDTDADPPVVDVEELTNTITERVTKALQGNTDGAGAGDSEPDATAGTAPTEQAATPVAPAAATDIAAQIEAGVRKVLGDQAHAEQHAAMEVPRKARKGLARALWGA